MNGSDPPMVDTPASLRRDMGLLKMQLKKQQDENANLTARLNEALKQLGIVSAKLGTIATHTEFKVDDAVQKVTGDYHIRGVVRAVFKVHDDGPTRYVVRHEAQGGGYFCHIYNGEQLYHESACV